MRLRGRAVLAARPELHIPDPVHREVRRKRKLERRALHGADARLPGERAAGGVRLRGGLVSGRLCRSPDRPRPLRHLFEFVRLPARLSGGPVRVRRLERDAVWFRHGRHESRQRELRRVRERVLGHVPVRKVPGDPGPRGDASRGDRGRLDERLLDRLERRDRDEGSRGRRFDHDAGLRASRSRRDRDRRVERLLGERGLLRGGCQDRFGDARAARGRDACLSGGRAGVAHRARHRRHERLLDDLRRVVGRRDAGRAHGRDAGADRGVRCGDLRRRGR